MNKIFLAVSLIFFVFISCKKPELIKRKPKRVVNFKPVLPSPPDYTYYTKEYEKDKDGVYSVYGVFQQLKDLVKKKVKVKGIVTEHHLCEEGKKECPKKPYIVIRDVKLPEFTLFVAADNDNGLEEFEIGKKYVFEGKLIQFTLDGRLFRSDGILLVKGKEVEKEGNESESGQTNAKNSDKK